MHKRQVQQVKKSFPKSAKMRFLAGKQLGYQDESWQYTQLSQQELHKFHNALTEHQHCR